MNDYKPCSKCKAQTHRLEVFPKGLCLACYRNTPEANQPITATELARMWGGK